MPIREKFGLGYLGDPASAEGERRRDSERAPSTFAAENVRLAMVAIGEKVLAVLKARPGPAELSDLVNFTGYTFEDLFPVIKELTARGLITSHSGKFALTTLGQQTHRL